MIGAMLFLRSFLLSLALFLAVVSQPLVHAGPMAGTMVVTLCADDGQRLVLIDARGEPVAPDSAAWPCPDCLPLWALAHAPALVAQIARRRFESARMARGRNRVGLPRFALRARGPPV